ncbi:branched-chain amino acid ABC transporter ATP-binding protein/permease [Variovorax sp. JS1663]|uniref:branched-chain amino acid ABC transporter ATP-binding protein/permease n=1 Tax=Variovorax sp. JS1663 TaxID=1851577 RepID=UPI000B344C40|nr:branched-chain amino acid ABC transporter ATP-binding protein/permease [Variovorax sp. JS1663]OUM00131.1 ABC transporter ATP-binding protein [Variovorax sp. JS1663]
MKRWLSHPVVQVAAVLAALSLLTLVTTLPLGRVTQVAIYVLYAAGIALLVGYLGLVPFGGSVFFGLAGYAAAIAMLRWFPGGSEFAGMAVAIGFAVLIAVPLGALILRRRGLYFSLLTLACTQICYEIAYKWTDFTGGENGLQRVPRPVLDSPLAFHLFVCGVVLAAVALLWRLAHSPLGRLFQAVRDNEQRAASLGFATYPVKLAAFVVSAAVTGLAGALLTFFMRGTYANSLSWEHAADAVLMTVLGGIHHVMGAVWGAVLFIVLEDQLGALLDHWWLVFAPILMLVTLAAPEGIHGLLRRLRGAHGWTLVRPGIPERPPVIAPFRPGEAAAAEAATGPLLTVRGLRKNFGPLVIAAGYDFDVHAASLHSFIGPNGAGKTTFFNMLSGVVTPDAGEVRFLGRDITRLPMHKRIRLGLARSFQIVSVFQNLSAFENVRLAVQAGRPGAYAPWGDAHRDAAANARVWSILDAVGLVHKAAEPCTDLSHGERRLLEIGITLATEARLLLLDEPLAGLAEADRVRVSALIRALARTHAVVLIEHDIDRVLALSDRITVLHQGRLIADGKPAEVAADPEVVRAYLGVPPDMQRRPAAAPADAGRGELLLSARGLAGGYGGGRVLDGAALEVHAGEAVALLGRNGVGKTTLLKALYGALPLEEGTIAWCGQDIRRLAPYQVNRLGMAIVPEGRRLFPNLTVLENLRIAMRPGGMSLGEVFELFPRLGTLRHARAENLSGGERQMVAIARALVAPARLILLDEPFEGLAPAVVNEVMGAILKLRRRVAMVIVEHHAEQVLAIVDRAVVLVNGRVAWDGDARVLAADAALQARLLGLVEASPLPAPSNHHHHRQPETEHA